MDLRIPLPIHLPIHLQALKAGLLHQAAEAQAVEAQTAKVIAKAVHLVNPVTIQEVAVLAIVLAMSRAAATAALEKSTAAVIIQDVSQAEAVQETEREKKAEALAVIPAPTAPVMAQDTAPVQAPNSVPDLAPATDSVDTPENLKFHSLEEKSVSPIKREVNSVLDIALLIDLCKLKSASNKELKIVTPANLIRELKTKRQMMLINYVTLLAML